MKEDKDQIQALGDELNKIELKHKEVVENKQ